MSAPTQAKQWLLANKPTDMPKLDGSDAKTHDTDDPAAFKQTTTNLTSPLPSEHVLLKTLSISNDPAQRAWISAGIDPTRLYTTPVETGDVMRARSLCEILDSTASAAPFQKGSYVLATTGWSSHAVVPAKECQPAPVLPGGASMTHHLGALGLTGLTAYYGLVEVAGAKAEDVVVVSGAAGATGSMVVQIAKGIVGCKRVVGIAGGASKCKWVTEVMGADACVDYKAGNFREELKKAVGDGVDVYFDNVGGDILDTMLTLIRQNGRVAACGAISNYNKGDPTGLKNWFEIIMNRIHIHGFIVTDAISRPGWIGEVKDKMLEGVKAGKVKLTDDMETVVPTKFDKIPDTWMGLFEGRNQGKLVTTLAD